MTSFTYNPIKSACNPSVLLAEILPPPLVRYLIIYLLLLPLMPLWAVEVSSVQDGVITVTVTEAGELYSYSSGVAAIKGSGATCLKLVGPLNASDFDNIKNMLKSGDAEGTITQVDMSEAVITTLPNHAFNNAAYLEAIELPAGLTLVDDYAFESCYRLAAIDLSHTQVTTLGSSAFYDCTALASVSLPATLTTMGSYTFFRCQTLTELDLTGTGVTEVPSGMCNGWQPDRMQLTTVRLPATITKIGSQAFYCCTNLTEFSLNVRGSLTIGSSAFYDCDKISSVNISAQRGLTLEDNAFGACNEITDITLSAKDDVVLGSSYGSPFTSCDKIETFTLHTPGKLTAGIALLSPGGSNETLTTVVLDAKGAGSTIGSNLVYGATKLTSITLPAGLVSLGERAFRDCESLTSIDLPSTLTSLGTAEDMFYNCKSLTSLNLNATGVTELGWQTFADCDALTSLSLPDGLTSLGRFTFQNCPKLTEMTIPSGITTIPDYLFYGCTSLSSVTLPSGITSIGNFAFSGCSQLTAITLPSGLTTIGNDAFSSSGLAQIDLPASVLTIGDGAFSSCNNLVAFYLNEGCTTIGAGMLSGDNLRIVYMSSTLTTINDQYVARRAFGGKAGMEIHMKTETPPATYQTQYFRDIQEGDVTLYVPKGAIDTYKASGYWWNNTSISNWTMEEEETDLTNLDDGEYTALQSLPAATGSNWNRPWTFGASKAETAVPQGVILRDGHVRSLILTGQNLTGTLPTSFFTAFPNLEILDLSNNHLTGEFATLLSGVTAHEHMNYIDLSGNEFTGNLYDLYVKVPTVQTLKAARNKIRDIFPILPKSVKMLDFKGQDLDAICNNLTFHELMQLKAAGGSTGETLQEALLPTVLVYYDRGANDSANDDYYSNNVNYYITDAPDKNHAQGRWFASLNHYFTSNALWNDRVNWFDNYSYDPNTGMNNGWYSGPLSGKSLRVWTDNRFTGSHFLITTDFIEGDANFDFNINVSDMQFMLNVALDEYYYDRRTPFNFTAANLITESDPLQAERINVQDVVASVNMLLDRHFEPVFESRRLSGGSAMNETNSVATLSFENGQLVLNCEMPVAAMHLQLSDDASWLSPLNRFTHAQRGNSHVFYSLMGNQLPAGAHVLATSDTYINIEYAMIVDADGKEIPLTISTQPTGIRTMGSDSNAAGTTIHDLQGRRVSHPQKGIYVINGKKQVVK